MDKLLPAIYVVLSGDSELTTTHGAKIYQWRNPQDPKTIKVPHVVFAPADDPDQEGYSGAATNPLIEVKVWGYDTQMYIKCTQAAQRIKEIFTGGFVIGGTTGGNLRWGTEYGFTTVDQPDAKTLLLLARFRCRYWSEQLITAITT